MNMHRKCTALSMPNSYLGLMKKIILICLVLIVFQFRSSAQEIIPFDTTKWSIKANAYLFENYKGKDAIYIQGGLATLKDFQFLNGTIEFDIFLKEQQGFPGIRFRAFDEANMESFYLRPHLSGKPDANQALPVINNLSAWQLYFGNRYSFPYEYKYDDWTHVKIVVNERQAQVYLDYAEKPNFSWNLFHEPRAGALAIGGGMTAFHYANFTVNEDDHEIVDFEVHDREPISGLIDSWEISDKFEEKELEDPSKIKSIIDRRKWGENIKVDEGTAANISRVTDLFNGIGNTVFARIEITSESDQLKLFEFGYSDRAIVILNGTPIYKGNNRWRSRDYRYLGTVGLFDAVYLDLKKGKNTLLLAVSEDFGGWLVTGRFAEPNGIAIVQ